MSAPTEPRSLASPLPLSLLAACRPRQWTKNLLVFAAPLFAFLFEGSVWLDVLQVFIAFCAISSAVYLLNDVLDVEADRAHPTKRHRPIASGLVSIPLGLLTAALLAVGSLVLGAAINQGVAGVLLAYGLIQVAYCLQLKRMPLLDLVCIAAGFLLRAVAGVVAAGLGFSPWFLLTVGLLALFLAVEKRKAELRICLDRGVITRKVLERYSLPLLQRLENIVSTSAFMSYALWAAGPTLNGASTSWMLISVPFVLVGIFRYQLLSDPEEADRRSALHPDRSSERPEEILLGDRGVRLTLLGWLATVSSVGIAHKLDLLPS